MSSSPSPNRLAFIKMHGLGNDFVVIDDIGKAKLTPMTAALAKKICDRRFGVGADQILWLKDAEDRSNDARMEILNADGSTAEMCGNGIRAVAVYLRDLGLSKGPHFHVETLAGIKKLSFQGTEVTVDMGAPKIGAKEGELLEFAGQKLRFIEVNVGNPHAVFFVEHLDQTPVAEWGPRIEHHPRFPKRTNVEFVEITGAGAIRVGVWERGAGITLACGTVACASAVATMATGRGKGPLEVALPGGKLRISWGGEGQPVLMTGPAVEVFRGEFFF
ncbi:MAG: diaminopimelate epimerase [Bdellovibrionota bacterium]